MFVRTVAVVALLSATLAYGEDRVAVEYSGILTVEFSAGAMSGPYAYTPTKERREMNMQGQNIVTIDRKDKGVSWQLMPDQKMYMESKIGANPNEEPTDLSSFTIESSVVGPEVLNGVATTKSKIIMTAKNGEKFGGFSWVTDEGITVKTDAIAMAKNSKQRIKMELTDLEVGPQDPSKFEIPAGYTRMDMSGMGMFNSMRGGGAGAMGAGEDADEDADEDEDEAPPPKKKWGGLKGALDILK